jgi:outer membrane immunogenic protein
MKRALSTIALATFVFGSASAADMRVKAPPVPIVTPTWTGFYVGGGLGYGMYNLDTQWFAAGLPFTMPLTQTMGGRGWLGTVTVGADYQFNDRIVAGVFADYDFSNIKGTIENQGAFSVGNMTQTAAWAIGARLGWLVSPDILTYVNAGYTQARFSSADMTLNERTFDPFFGSVVSNISAHTYSGFFVGGGVEAKLDGLGPFGRGWSWRTEYRYANYQSATLTDLCTNAVACPGSPFVGVPAGTVLSTVSIHPIVQTVRSELIYKFDWGGPVVRPANSPSLFTKAPPLSPSVRWTGLYLGVGAGYGMFNLDTQWTGVFDPFTMPLTQTMGGRGWLGTVTAGADYQFNDRIVAGVFADYDWANIAGTLEYQTAFETGTVKETSAWAIGARVGWLITPQMLAYVNGGYTQARLSETHLTLNRAGALFFGSAPQTVPGHTFGGWFLGTGMETAVDAILPFGKGWFWRNEYRYAKYESATLPNVCTDAVICPFPPLVIPVGTTVANVAIQPVVQTIRSEILFKFN